MHVVNKQVVKQVVQQIYGSGYSLFIGSGWNQNLSTGAPPPPL